MKRPVNRPGNDETGDIPPNIAALIEKYMDKQGLIAKYGPQASAYIVPRIEQLYARYQMPSIEWLIRMADDESQLSQMSAEIRTAFYVIATEVYHNIFEKAPFTDMSPEQDWILSLWRTLLSIGYQIRISEENGEFRPE